MALAANALTDYATVAAELGLGGATDQALIERLIGAASGALDRFCERGLAYQVGIVEPAPMYGSPKLLLQRTPLVAVGQVLIDGAALAGTDYDLATYGDREQGYIWRDAGWQWSALLRAGRFVANLTADQSPQTEKKRATVNYAGGFITPPQAYSVSAWPGAFAAIPVGTLCLGNGAGALAQVWVASPVDPLQALTTGAAQPTWTASPAVGATIADANVSWAYLGTAGAAGARGTAVSLPPELEEACIITAKAFYRERRDNPNVKSESMLGVSMSYDRSGGLPQQAMDLASHYRRTV
jgi:hypothetical protein